jgi:hypothetical protein
VSSLARGDTDGHRVSAWQRAVVRARRLQLARLGLVALAAILIGFGLGRWSVPDADPDVRAAVERTVQPLALDADGIWTSAEGGSRRPVAEAIPLVRDGERLDEVQAWAEEWLSAYDIVLRRLVGLDLHANARPVQRQFISAVTLSRDAVELLQHATRVEDDDGRQALVSEALRLRQRAEHLTQSARASVRDLGGHEGDVARHPDLPPLGEVVEESG